MTAIIHNLRTHTSNIDKQIILNDEATDLDKKLFQWTYDPFKTYKQKFEYVNWMRLGEVKEEMFALLNKLASRELTGTFARMSVVHFAEAHGDLIKLVCNKDLDCGVSAVTLNKVFGEGFIPKFNIQLAKEVDIDKLTMPILGQLKYNGARVITLIENGIVTFKSRGGHEFGYPELRDIILQGFESDECYMLDGELTFGDSQGSDHTAVSGMINSAIKGTPVRNGLGLIYHVFDSMPLNEFNRNKCDRLYDERLSLVARHVDAIGNAKVQVATTYGFRTKEDINQQYEHLLSLGYEGLILKYKTHKYTFKKNANWIKMKATETADLLCVDYQEGKGKYEGMIGALVCEGIVEGKHVNVSVGSGLNDNDRSLSPNCYVGKVIEVDYNKVIQDSKTGGWSLFLPRFVIVRKDKS